MRRRITLSGAVQGMGFRPFVYRRARQLGLAGWVLNSTAGVTIEAEGEAAGIAALIDSVKESPPPNARIASVSVEEIAPQVNHRRRSRTRTASLRWPQRA